MVLLNEPRITGQVSLSQAYQICEDITKSASTSFLRSFKSLPTEKRLSVHALYAFDSFSSSVEVRHISLEFQSPQMSMGRGCVLYVLLCIF